MIKLVYPNGTTITGFVENTSIYQGTSLDTATAVGYIARSDTSGRALYIVTTQGGFIEPVLDDSSTEIRNSANSVTLSNTTADGDDVSSITNYDGTSTTVLYTLKRYSGDIIYVDNFAPITRDATRETIRIVIQF